MKSSKGQQVQDWLQRQLFESARPVPPESTASQDNDRPQEADRD